MTDFQLTEFLKVMVLEVLLLFRSWYMPRWLSTVILTIFNYLRHEKSARPINKRPLNLPKHVHCSHSSFSIAIIPPFTSNAKLFVINTKGNKDLFIVTFPLLIQKYDFVFCWREKCNTKGNNMLQCHVF